MTYHSVLVLASLLAATACTTLKPIELEPEVLQRKIASENVLQSGKRAKIVTTDGRIHKVRIRNVNADSGTIETDAEPVQIAEIVAVETRDFSMGKTALLATSSYMILALIAIAMGPALLL